MRGTDRPGLQSLFSNGGVFIEKYIPKVSWLLFMLGSLAPLSLTFLDCNRPATLKCKSSATETAP